MDLLLVILAIIGGIAGFFKDRSNNNPEKQKRTFNAPRPTPTPSGGNFNRNPVRQLEGQHTITVAAQQEEEHSARLAEQQNTVTQTEMEKRKRGSFIGEVEKRSHSNETGAEQQLKGEIGRNLSQKGLVNGIIMSEILGPPRAVKPYQSITKQRRK